MVSDFGCRYWEDSKKIQKRIISWLNLVIKEQRWRKRVVSDDLAYGHAEWDGWCCHYSSIDNN